jgi:tetratricopeptide (TPR) repeat protein
MSCGLNTFACILLALPASQVFAASIARGFQLLEQGNLEEAHRELKAVVESDSRSTDGWILLGITDYHLRNDQEAINELGEALKLEPSSVQAHYVLGQIYFRKSDLEGAEQHLTKAYAGNVTRADILQPLSRVLILRGDAPSLVRWLEAGLNAGIENAGLLFSLGWAYGESGAFDKAEETAGKALRMSPNNQLGWLTLVKSQLQQGEQGRVRALETLGHADPVPAWQRSYLVGLANYMLDRHNTAVPALETATKTAPQRVAGPIHLLLANCLISVDREEDADRHYRIALETLGKNALAHYYYGLFLRHHEKLGAAEAEFRAALAADPKLAEASLHLGMILDQTGRQAEAIKILEGAIADAPDLARLYYALGRIYNRQGKSEQATAMMRRFEALKADESEQSRQLAIRSAMSALSPNDR